MSKKSSRRRSVRGIDGVARLLVALPFNASAPNLTGVAGTALIGNMDDKCMWRETSVERLQKAFEIII